MKTRTLFISFDKLAKAEGCATIATLALVCNDLAIANSSMGRYAGMQKQSLAHIRRGGTMYFSRTMSGHLNEGMLAITEVRNNRGLTQLVDRCSAQAQEAFANLCKCLPGESEYKRFKQYVGSVRNRMAFHYGSNDILWAIRDRATRASADTGSLTAGEDIHTSRFEFGDDLIDSIVVRRLWRIPRAKDLRSEADRAANWCDRKCREFL